MKPDKDKTPTDWHPVVYTASLSVLMNEWTFKIYTFYSDCLPGDFRSGKSPQTLPAIFIVPFDYVKRFQNLTFTVRGRTDIRSNVLSASSS